MEHWSKSIRSYQWKTLFAAQLGWMLDAMDIMFYAFALTAIQSEFKLSSAEAGALASVTLIASAIGGIFFGTLADKIGRARALVFSIISYSIFTAMTATAQSIAWLILWRTLVGFGMGGEWSAGSVLVSESWPTEHRGKAIGIMQSGWAIGYILAAIISAVILPQFGWRILFVVGILPAFLTLWIRRNVPEPEIWIRNKENRKSKMTDSLLIIFKKPLLKKTLTASLLTTSVLFAYWGLFTWMPTFLSKPVEQGGAGLGIVKSSTWIVPMQIGAFFGYLSFGFLADRFGRRPVFLTFLIAAALLVPLYGQLARHEILLLVIGPFIGFFGHGYFSVFGAMLAELFPTNIRGTAQGFTYNIGRAFSALAPFIIGALADNYGIGSAFALTAFFFLLGAVIIFLLPETKGQQLT
ncbi:MAG: MFS transporter [Ignavibacteriales bacterium]|nr:MFS transporter [Ignavibacteriales bacterium]